MADQASISFIDYNGERSTFSINVADLSGANFDATNTALADLQATAEQITLGTVAGRTITDRTKGSTALPTEKTAQRETKWLITCEDITEWLNPPDNDIPNAGFGKLFTYELPTAQPTLLEGNSEIIFPVEVPEQAVTNFIADFEAVAVSPYNGNLAVRQIRYVGRNL